MGNVHMEATQVNYREGNKKMSVAEAIKNAGSEITPEEKAWIDTIPELASKEIIAPEFDAEAGTYEIGDLVMYEGKLYEFTSAHETPGDWDETEVTEKTVSDEIDSLKSGLTVLGNITKNIVIGEYTTFYDALRSFTDGVRYCGFWSINNYTDKPTGTTNSANYALFFNTSTAYYYGKILLFSAGDVYLGYFATDTATAITWTKLAVAT